MKPKAKLFFNWSSGKDSALALYYLQQQNEFQIDLLFTSVSAENKRISMHGLHENLLKKQAEAIGLPLEIMYLPSSTEMDVYNALMEKKTMELKARGFSITAFGDIFLEDLRVYREKQLGKVGFKAIFPLWKRNTKQLITEFLDLGFKTIVVAANVNWFGAEFVGSEITKERIEALPNDVDPCGENGEFHTFCYDGPIFKKPLKFKIGEKIIKSYTNPIKPEEEINFWYCDLIVEEHNIS